MLLRLRIAWKVVKRTMTMTMTMTMIPTKEKRTFCRSHRRWSTKAMIAVLAALLLLLPKSAPPLAGALWTILLRPSLPPPPPTRWIFRPFRFPPIPPPSENPPTRRAGATACSSTERTVTFCSGAVTPRRAVATCRDTSTTLRCGSTDFPVGWHRSKNWWAIRIPIQCICRCWEETKQKTTRATGRRKTKNKHHHRKDDGSWAG
mmetsp:Transcript_10454/g.22015  ORF Transcript_10454/g.22015 Transcript_10454/m.22015 type:complete len:204 (-) Transcript_10454:626-1237(-)